MTTDNENDLILQRRQDLKELRNTGVAYSNQFKRDSFSSDLHSKYENKSKEDLENTPIKVSIAGRMMSRRIMGKASFAHIQDKALIQPILEMNVKEFYQVLEEKNVSACGFGAIASTIIACKKLGATKGELLSYATSGDVIGDKDSVVGYGSIKFV